MTKIVTKKINKSTQQKKPSWKTKEKNNLTKEFRIKTRTSNCSYRL